MIYFYRLGLLSSMFMVMTLFSCMGQETTEVQTISTKSKEKKAAETIVLQYFDLAIAGKNVSDLLGTEEVETDRTQTNINGKIYDPVRPVRLNRILFDFMAKENPHYIAKNGLIAGELNTVKLEYSNNYKITVELFSGKNLIEYETFTIKKFQDGKYRIISIQFGH